jgi:hypothetical protein
MKEYYIGLDVRKDSVFTAVLDGRKVLSHERADSGVLAAGEVPADPPQLVKAIKRHQKQGKVWAACGIIPADAVFRPGDEKKIKTGRRDALLIAGW